MMRKTFAAGVLSLSLAACGGGQKATPAAAPETAPPEAAAPCCCDYVAELGDPEGDEWSEEQTYERLSEAECADRGGSCVGDEVCDGADLE